MKIHKEGFTIIGSTVLGIVAIVGAIGAFVENDLIVKSIAVAGLILVVLVTQFFRVPKRVVPNTDAAILAPSDGKVVVIEEVEEKEYFNCRMRQVSIFMSPLNVHVQWYPVNGAVSYYKYHPGLYLAAFKPKSSTENERSTLVLKRNDGVEVMFRQIAGAVARRIVNYSKVDQAVAKGQEAGFIKFGSRIDMFLPLDAEINVELGQKVKGIETIVATL